MVNQNRRVFLEQGLGLASAMLILPAANNLKTLKPSIVRNNSDEPIFNNDYISNETEQKTEIVSEPIIDESEINNQITELRKYAKNAPSSEEIARQHTTFKRKGVLEKIIDSTDRLKINSKYLEPILCIEQGSPYKQADYGLNWISPSGCRGIAQLSFGAFFDVIRWYNEQNLTQELSGKQVIISREAALESLGKTTEKKTDKSPKEGLPDPEIEVDSLQQNKAKVHKPTGQVDNISPQIHFNIQVVIPENASPETYETIFKSIATHLLHRDNG